MSSTFQSTLWQIGVPLTWKAQACNDCVEFTQPEGVGALHISGAQKTDGPVLDTETLSQLRENCPRDAEAESVICGDFAGYAAAFVDAGDGHYWKKWFLYCRHVLLFVTYNCRRGEEEFEVPRASALLSSLRCRA